MKSLALVTLLFAAQPFSGICSAAEPVASVAPTELDCVDQTAAVAIVDPKLDADFFRSKEASYPAHIVEHEDGHLENTLGDKVSKTEATKIEHTAKCLSSHQGEHLMSFCNAQLVDGGLLLEVSGGLPAYASSLTLRIGNDKSLKCRFAATYPMTIPGEKLMWTITKKAFKLKSDNLKVGERLFGWLSVEFEETCTIKGKVSRKRHKIEGYVKPVVIKPTSNPKSIGEQATPERPLPVAEFR